jgi:hypothetical protein
MDGYTQADHDRALERIMQAIIEIEDQHTCETCGEPANEQEYGRWCCGRRTCREDAAGGGCGWDERESEPEQEIDW